MTNPVQPVGEWIHEAPLRDRSTVFIHISEDGSVTQAHGLGDKRDLCCDLTGTLLVGWTGRWRTDVRIAATDDDRDALALAVE